MSRSGSSDVVNCPYPRLSHYCVWSVLAFVLGCVNVSAIGNCVTGENTFKKLTGAGPGENVPATDIENLTVQQLRAELRSV